MESQEIVPEPLPYQATQTQLLRRAELRKFNLIRVYLPIAFFSLVTLALIISLLFISLNPPQEQTPETISGIADAIVILGIIPLMMICAIFPILFLAATFQVKSRDSAPIRRTQSLLWQIDAALMKIGATVTRIAGKIGAPFITIHSRFAYFRTLWGWLTDKFR